jgi:hypothetical protein
MQKQNISKKNLQKQKGLYHPNPSRTTIAAMEGSIHASDGALLLWKSRF